MSGRSLGREWLTAALAVVMVGWYISPRRSSVTLIEAMGQSYAGAIRAAVGSIEKRHPDAPAMVRAMDPATRDDVFAALHPADRMWIEAMMIGTGQGEV
jgi:hypothetical protein